MRFTFLSAGESHGPQLTVIVTGMPAGVRLDRERIDRDLARRQHGYGRGGRMKIEHDEAQIEIGRASCRERGWMWGGGGGVKKKRGVGSDETVLWVSVSSRG